MSYRDVENAGLHKGERYHLPLVEHGLGRMAARTNLLPKEGPPPSLAKFLFRTRYLFAHRPKRGCAFPTPEIPPSPLLPIRLSPKRLGYRSHTRKSRARRGQAKHFVPTGGHFLLEKDIQAWCRALSLY